MKYKLFTFCPDKTEIISNIIGAASRAGAGVSSHYTHVAFVARGTGQWKTEKGAHPYIGKIGKLSKVKEVKIEMQCDAEYAQLVYDAIKKVHPYEDPAIEFVALEDVS